MPSATDFTRDDCLVGQKRRTYRALLREWCCEDCGGRLTTRWSPEHDWSICCGRCHGANFIHQAQYQRERHEALEVVAGLPAELAALLAKED